MTSTYLSIVTQDHEILGWVPSAAYQIWQDIWFVALMVLSIIGLEFFSTNIIRSCRRDVSYSVFNPNTGMVGIYPVMFSCRRVSRTFIYLLREFHAIRQLNGIAKVISLKVKPKHHQMIDQDVVYSMYKCLVEILFWYIIDIIWPWELRK